jgi:hypothetical protein
MYRNGTQTKFIFYRDELNEFKINSHDKVMKFYSMEANNDL